MEKSQAREILNDWVKDPTTSLPIKDQIVLSGTQYVNDQKEIVQWTFKGLIKIAYDLTDKPT